MIDVRQMAALVAVAEEQNFERAASRLHITQSAVSQRVKQLEEKLGQVLLVRTVPVRATEAGQQVIRYYRQLNLLEDELRAGLSGRNAQGFTQVALGVNTDSLDTWFLEAVRDVIDHEKLLLNFKVEDQDQTLDLLKTGEVLGCITSVAKPMPGCTSVPLGVMVYRAMASREYLQRYFPNGVTRAGFLKAPVAEFSNKDQLQNRYLADFFQIGPHDYPRHRVPSSISFCEMVRRGLACGMIPDQQISALFADEDVVDMTPGKNLAVPLYWQVWNLRSELIRELTDALVKAASVALESFANYPVLTHPGNS